VIGGRRRNVVRLPVGPEARACMGICGRYAQTDLADGWLPSVLCFKAMAMLYTAHLGCIRMQPQTGPVENCYANTSHTPGGCIPAASSADSKICAMLGVWGILPWVLRAFRSGVPSFLAARTANHPDIRGLQEVAKRPCSEIHGQWELILDDVMHDAGPESCLYRPPTFWPAATKVSRLLLGGREGGLHCLPTSLHHVSTEECSIPTDTLQQAVARSLRLSHGVGKVLGPAGGSKLVACEHVRAIHGCCKGDASHLPSSGLPEACLASLEQCIIFQKCCQARSREPHVASQRP
jgi:hypothetical protein